jgi:DNA-binding NtrC family response regulator
METRQLRAWSGSDAIFSGLAAPALQDASAPPWTIFLWDPRPARLQVVSRLIASCGVRVRCNAEVSAISQVERSHSYALVVVALEACPATGDRGVDVIRSMQQRGFRVLCYADGAPSWPLRVRCQLLVAGAGWILDSASAEFTHELPSLLTHLLQAAASRRDEEYRVKQVMKKLGSVGESPAMLAVFHTILRVSPLSDLPVLITGETGTGKELLAHAIHQLDLKRCHGPFIAVNCGAINPGLAESELFGHRRGAFTDADRDRKGLIRAAEGGVLFLDEIGELDDTLQAKLLRVLQEHCVLGVGEDHEVAVNVRIIAATHRNLNAMVQQHTFRADLFHRLHTLAIHIPPLRERPADLKPLIEHFLVKYQALKPAGPLAVDPDVIAALTQVDLPGNARQVENLVLWALVNKDDKASLMLRDLPLDIWQQVSEQGGDSWDQSAPEYGEPALQLPASKSSPQTLPFLLVNLLDSNSWNLARALQHCERLLLEAALHKAHGNQSHMARLLGITPRSVYNKVHKHHLHRAGPSENAWEMQGCLP